MVAGLSDARVIDIHAHAVIAETMGAAGRFGPEMGQDPDGSPWFRVGDYRLQGVRYAGSPFIDVELRLEKMTAAGIDFQVLSPNPLTFFHFIDRPEAISYCRKHNDHLAELVRRNPERLAACAALPMQDVGAAIEELHRAVNDLGMIGGYIGTDLPRPLDDRSHDGLYEACVKLDAPLFIHPGPAGIDGPAGDIRLKRFDLDVVVGFAAQEAIAVASLIYGEVIDRHPRLDICLSHGGGSSAYLLGRLARAATKRPWSPAQLRKDGAFEARMRQIWFDTHLNSPRSEAFLVETVGTERLVYGTNFVGWDAPDSGSAHAPEAYLADNARRLLRANGRRAQR